MRKFMGVKSLLIVLIVAAVLSGCFYWQNNGLTVTYYHHSDSLIPAGFSGFSILQVSDLHNKSFGKNQEVLLESVKALAPDVILITGDLVDRRRYNLKKAMTFVEGAVALAPVYYAPGNHEAWSGRYEEIRSALQEAGVIVLDNSEVVLEQKGDVLHLMGLRDPAFLVSGYITKQLDAWQKLEGYKMLLAHRPDLFPLYVESQVNLVFSGHAHGGQIRLPLVGGIFAPNQGFFPEYSHDNYHQEMTTMYVSRGLGNSIFPLRVHNRPELVMVTLDQN